VGWPTLREQVFDKQNGMFSGGIDGVLISKRMTTQKFPGCLRLGFPGSMRIIDPANIFMAVYVATSADGEARITGVWRSFKTGAYRIARYVTAQQNYVMWWHVYCSVVRRNTRVGRPPTWPCVDGLIRDLTPRRWPVHKFEMLSGSIHCKPPKARVFGKPNVPILASPQNILMERP
jgi:hypothetical protein